MDKHPYNFITVHKGQKILTQARTTDNKTIKCLQATLAEAAWGADVAHAAQRDPVTGAPARKLNFQSEDDALEALVQEAGCTRQEAKRRVS
jgi:hypothetical protein